MYKILAEEVRLGGVGGGRDCVFLKLHRTLDCTQSFNRGETP